MSQDIFIIGATGKIGGELIEQIYASGDCDPTRHKNPTRIVGLASSEEYLFSPEGIKEIEAFDLFLSGAGKRYFNLKELTEVVAPIEKEVVFVDVTDARELMCDFHKKVIAEGKNKIVTANKAPLVLASTEEFRELTSDTHRYGYRCSVMAGADALYWIRKSVDLGEKIVRMTGVLSGTLGFICAKLNEGATPSEIIIEAVEKGYSEPDVRFDLRGTDVVSKAVILARTAGFDVNLEDVELKPFIPESMLEHMGKKGVWANPRMQDRFDIEYQLKAQEAYSSNAALIYGLTMTVAKNKPNVKIGLDCVPRGNLLDTHDNDNRLLIETDKGFVYDSGPVSGAGVKITARNIRADLVDLLPERKVAYPF